MEKYVKPAIEFVGFTSENITSGTGIEDGVYTHPEEE